MLVVCIAFNALNDCTCFAQQVSNSLEEWEERERESLESFLAEQNLGTLLVEHLESELEKTSDPEQRKKLASKLAVRYSQKLISLQGNSKELMLWQTKAQRLTAIFPDLNSDELRIASLHARYLDLENQFREAWKLGAKQQTMSDLIQPWEILSQDLVSATAAWQEKSDDLFALQQADPDQANSVARKLSLVESQLLHCHYLNGWTNYFRAASSTEARQSRLQLAESEFRKFLQIDATQPLNGLSRKWFDFTSPWTVRSIVGLASVLHVRNLADTSDHLFSLIENQNIDLASRDSVPFWRLSNYSFFRQFDRSIGIADEVAIRNDISDKTLAKFWLLAFESAQIAKDDNPQLGEILKRRSLAGLTRQLKGGILNELAESNPSAFDVAAGEGQFNDYWVKGYLDYFRSQQNKDADLLQSARRLLQRAQQIEPDAAYKDDWARCTYLLAWIDFQKEEYERAANGFQQVAKLLENSDRSLASHSQWQAIESLSKLKLGNKKKSSEVFSAIERMLRKFPDSEFAKRAEFEKVRIEIQSVPHNQAINRLEKVKRGNPNYPMARSEIVGLRYRRWIAAQKSNSSSAAKRFIELEEESERYTSNAKFPAELKLKSQLMVVDALVRENPIRPQKLSRAIDLAKSFADVIPAKSKTNIEFRYFQLMAAQKTGNVDQAVIHSQWLVDQAAGTRFEMPALIYLARKADQDLQLNPADPVGARDQAITFYERLSKQLGQSRDKLLDSSNARVAIARLADLNSQNGDLAKADQIYDLLLSCYPDNVKYLKQSARLKQSSGKQEQAIKIWSRLAKGVAPGTDLWFESKIALIDGLSVNDKESARKLYRQTVQLGGEISEEWKPLFERLRVKLSIESEIKQRQ